jgi:hypothetical protein
MERNERNEHATAEKCAKFTVGKFTCTIVQSRLDEEFSDLTVSHPDYPFTCLISTHYLNKWNKKTGRMFLSHNVTRDIDRKYKLTNGEAQSVKSNVKYYCEQTKEIPAEPSYMTLNSDVINPSRLEKFYTKWFEYLKISEYEPYLKFAEELTTKKNGNASTIETILNDVPTANKTDHHDKVHIIGAGASITFDNTSSYVSMDVYTSRMTLEQKSQLFKYVEEMMKSQ